MIGPSQIPRIRELAQAEAFPELAVLSVAAHGKEPGAETLGLAAALACVPLPPPRATQYLDAILIWLSEPARRALLEYLNMHHYEYQSEFARKYVEEGRKDGQQNVLARQLRLKFGELPAWALERLQAADDPDIERWTERVLTAATLDEVFAG